MIVEVHQDDDPKEAAYLGQPSAPSFSLYVAGRRGVGIGFSDQRFNMLYKIRLEHRLELGATAPVLQRHPKPLSPGWINRRACRFLQDLVRRKRIEELKSLFGSIHLEVDLAESRRR